MSKAKTYRDSLYGRPNTIKTKLSMFNNHIAPFSTTLQDPDEIVRACMKSWKEDELSLGTIKSCMVVLGEYMKLTYGIVIDKKRLMFQNFEEIPRPRQKVKAMTKANARRLQEALTWPDDKVLQDMVIVHLNTGLRRGELLGLIWADIDFLNGCVRVQRSKDFATLKVGPTKTKKIRTVPMSEKVEEIMSRRYNVGVSELDFVFPSKDLNPYLKKVCTNLAIPDVTVHGLRHTFATRLLEQGISPKVVSDLLGHDKLSTTLDIYWNCIPNQLKLENIYGDTAKKGEEKFPTR